LENASQANIFNSWREHGQNDLNLFSKVLTNHGQYIILILVENLKPFPTLKNTASFILAA